MTRLIVPYSRYLQKQEARYGVGRQGHSGRFKVWRWEAGVQQMMGWDWREKAIDKDGWAGGIEAAAGVVIRR